MALIPFLFLLVFLLGVPIIVYAQELLHHALDVSLDPEKHVITVTDTITLPSSFRSQTESDIRLLLHRGLRPSSPTPNVHTHSEPLDDKNGRVHLERIRVKLPPETLSFVIEYQGRIHHPLQHEGEEYARSFRDTPGIISNEGTYLAGSTAWYPQFDTHLFSFTLDVTVPPGWNAVSQGERTKYSLDARRVHVRWESPEPQEEIFLIAGEFMEYRQSVGPVEAMAFLRSPDQALAQKYLDTTDHYIEMYSRLLGPYPYKKFALVENFWDTGFGMPSFTLLGPKIIRFPFILHSSYPHEILHNWWGRGVYVDFASGNWSEGLTAYLADHLVKEQRGTAVEFRRSTLQRYADYVAASKDFPLTEFRSRHSPATEAVGYGKTLMFFHMLRQQLGDEAFIDALRAFYKDNAFREATYDDLRQAFESASGEDLASEFAQWIPRAGAPRLRIIGATARPEKQGFLLTATVEQEQPGPPYYRLHIPLAITLEGQKNAYQTTVTMPSKVLSFSLHLPHRPVRLDVDPEFDLFRRLDRNEIPPALSRAFGAENILIVLPSNAPETVQEGFRELADSWRQSQSGHFDVKADNEIQSLPQDRAVWLFGWDNRFIARMDSAVSEYAASISNAHTHISPNEFSRSTHSVILSARHPENPYYAMTWLGTDNVAAMPGLGRKLPHYGKYSYLVFEGDEPTNVAKGLWPTVNSPMSVSIAQTDGRVFPDATATLAPRRALAYLPEIFSETRMAATIQWLASEDRRGRGLGTPELDAVAEYLAQRFREIGLEPAGDREGSYFQTWKDRVGDPPRDVVLKNVVGVIPGRKPELAGQSVVIGAHYDHLGVGWPDVHKGDEGKIHPGADDNASGVAVLVELAHILRKSMDPDRTVVFAAFSGEEAGLRGSKQYVAQAQRFPADKIIGMLNLDTVGRLENRTLTIFGTGSAREWIHILMGAGYVTGVPIDQVLHDFGSSDQKSFLDAGVPAIQFFSGPHLDYHRPTDTIDKIDARGLTTVTAVAKEVIEYLAGRPDPLTSTVGTNHAQSPATESPRSPTRNVSLGTVPDFAHQGKGVRITGVVPGSAAEAAGLKVGDVILFLGTTAIDDLRAFSDALGRLRPGEEVAITYVRNGETHTIRATVTAR